MVSITSWKQGQLKGTHGKTGLQFSVKYGVKIGQQECEASWISRAVQLLDSRRAVKGQESIKLTG